MLNKVTRSASIFLKKHGPKILLGAGIIGTGAAGVYAVSKTPEAMDKIEEKRSEKEEDEPLTTKELIESTWRCYAPALAIYIFSSACLVTSGTIMTKETAALTSAYEICRQSYDAYRRKTVETMGADKEKEMRQVLLAEKIQENPPVTYYTEVDDGRFPCREDRSTQYFRTSMDELRQGINKVNECLLKENFLSENDVRYAMNWPLIESVEGELLGYNIDDGYLDLVIGYESGPGRRPAACVRLDRIGKTGYNRVYK